MATIVENIHVERVHNLEKHVRSAWSIFHQTGAFYGLDGTFFRAPMKFRFRPFVGAALASIMIAGCTPAASIKFNDRASVPAMKAECTAKGGELGTIGNTMHYICWKGVTGTVDSSGQPSPVN